MISSKFCFGTCTTTYISYLPVERSLLQPNIKSTMMNIIILKQSSGMGEAVSCYIKSCHSEGHQQLCGRSRVTGLFHGPCTDWTMYTFRTRTHKLAQQLLHNHWQLWSAHFSSLCVFVCVCATQEIRDCFSCSDPTADPPPHPPTRALCRLSSQTQVLGIWIH